MVGVLAISLTAALFWFGGPKISANDFGSLHNLVHVFTFALLTLLYARALPKLPGVWIGVCMVAMGGAHELYQYATGGLAFEYGDFALNAVGAVLGVASMALLKHKTRGHAQLP